ncbi:MAG: hypothetical protein V4455_00550 [Pseudomonadota bacterium]
MSSFADKDVDARPVLRLLARLVNGFLAAAWMHVVKRLQTGVLLYLRKGLPGSLPPVFLSSMALHDYRRFC